MTDEGPEAVPPQHDAAGETEGTGPEAPHAAPRPGPGQQAGEPRWAMLAMTVVAAVVSTVTAVLLVLAVQGFLTEHGRDGALAAGREAAASLTSFNFETAEADVQRLNDSTTPTFENGFAQDKDSFVKFLRDGKVKMAGTVTEAGVLSYDGDTAHILVAVKAQVSNAQQPQAEARNYRMDITMVRDGMGWRADGARFIA